MVLGVKGAMKRVNPWVASLTMNFKNLFLRRKILSKAFNSHMVCYIVINNFFMSFVVGPTILHKILETDKRIREMYPIFDWKFNC